MRTQTFAYAFLAALSATALVALACSSSGSTTDDGQDNSEGAGANGDTGPGGSGTGASSAAGGSKGTGTGGTSLGTGTGGNGTGAGNGAGGGGLKLDAGAPNPDAYFANDPPPMSCDGGNVMPPVVTGTLDCPSDKNREGCLCPMPGMTAACWPGLRADRGHGICMDGMTTCNAVGEGSTGTWGPCMGYVLPEMGVDGGAAACKCFSGGTWKIDNLSPCFITEQGSDTVLGGESSVLMAGQITCPQASIPVTPPTAPWSTDSLTVDCAGHFKLCYTLKAGSVATASPSDCTMAQSCVEGDYSMENVSQMFPPLPSWATTTQAQVQCASQFNSSGGYGEMTVEGLSVECDTVENHVFNRVQYCPSVCETSAGMGNPMCTNCMAGGSGSFGG